MIEDPRSAGEVAEASESSPDSAEACAVPIAELDRVTIGRQVEGDEGETIPSGSSGTIVAIWAGGAAYEVEFVQPVPALATVRADVITAHHPRQRR